MIERIISGGQTGADSGGMIAATELGITILGFMPQGFRTEAGPRPEYAALGLVEDSSYAYQPRTIKNVQMSSGVVLFGNTRSAGSRLTAQTAISLGKPLISNPSTDALRAWIEQHEITVLMIAGNRESVNPGIGERVRAIVVEALTTPAGRATVGNPS